MHTLWLGVGKQFITLWMDSSKYVTRNEKEILERRLSLLKMPMIFSRRPRTWGEGSWKGIILMSNSSNSSCGIQELRDVYVRAFNGGSSRQRTL
jgi:hypothetical protein